MDSEHEYLTLRGLLSGVRETLEESFPEKLWIKAELSSVQARANGHCYLELCEQQDGSIVAKARAVIWRNRYPALAAYFYEVTGSNLAAGMQLLLRVQAGYSEIYGLTLTVDEIEPEFTLGAAERQRRETLARLEREGLLEKQRRLALPPLPRVLAVISAPDAAGYGDFCRHLDENPYGFKFAVTLFSAVMQGESAPESIVDALERIESSTVHYDAVLIMRGGGSSLDLACFDDYGLAFTIANYTLPVFTAIGHDRDTHVADLVAFHAVKTPTALAALFIDAFAAEDERLEQYATRLKLAFTNKISALLSRLDVLESRIAAADPRNILKRGYVLPLDGNGRTLKSVKALREGDSLTLMFADGTLRCRIEAVEPKN